LLCIQVENSFMASPWTGARLIYCTVLAEGTGRKSRKRAGGFSAQWPHFLVSRAANQLLSFPYEEGFLDCPFARAFRSVLQRVQRGSRKSGGCERDRKQAGQ
jgi:hypothetical protein